MTINLSLNFRRERGNLLRHFRLLRQSVIGCELLTHKKQGSGVRVWGMVVALSQPLTPITHSLSIYFSKHNIKRAYYGYDVCDHAAFGHLGQCREIDEAWATKMYARRFWSTV